MNALILVLAAQSGPSLPYPHQGERYNGPVESLPGFVTGSCWRDLLPSDDGKFAVSTGGRYRWTELPNPNWSQSEAISVGSGPEPFTTSQVSHLPTAHRIMNFNRECVAARDRSLLMLFSSENEGPIRYASLIRFQARGPTPNPITKLRRAYPPDFLTRQQGAAIAIEPKPGGARLSPINLSVAGNAVRVVYGDPIDVPQRDTSPLRPVAVDTRAAKVLTAEFATGGVPKLHLHEYLARTKTWRELEAPSDANRPQATGAGFFYWNGRLLFSPTAASSDAGLYREREDDHGWEKLANCQVLALSTRNSVWIVRDPKDDSVWIEHMK